MQRAFSLVELSIVLVILGLLAGAILAGKSLVQAAELRNVTTTIQRYNLAVQTFRGKYFSLPGDITNATAFWGAANTAGSNGQCADGYTNTGSGTQTCNGNGDGSINWRNSGGHENYRAWQHLANAGLIEGTFSGISGPSPSGSLTDDIIGTNIPELRYNRGYKVGVAFRDPSFSQFLYNTARNGNMILLGATGHPDKYIEVSALHPEDAWNVDSKIDDGSPSSGKIQTMPGYWSTCTTSISSGAAYNFTLTGTPSCVMTFQFGF